MCNLETDKREITKELIEKVCEKALLERMDGINYRYADMLENAIKDKEADHIATYILLSMAISCTIAMETMQQVLCELLGLEDAGNPGECNNASNTDNNE